MTDKEQGSIHQFYFQHVFGVCEFVPDASRLCLQKDRSQIECYWETQPGGCRKPHCVFKHSARSGAGGVQDAKPAAGVCVCVCVAGDENLLKTFPGQLNMSCLEVICTIVTFERVLHARI